MTQLSAATVVSLNKEVAFTVIDDEAVVMGVADDKLFGANPIATEILQYLEAKPATLEMIVTHLLARFEVSPAVCEADTQAFIESLLEQNFVSIQD